jgi:hypothetical protein
VKQQEFLKSIKHLSASEVAGLIRRTDPEVLSACKPKIISLYRQVYRFYGGGYGKAEDPMMLDADAVVVALINTASFSDILKLKRIPIPFWAPVSDFFEQHKPEWMREALELLLHPDDVFYLEPLWRDGLYEAPSCDALVHGYFDVRLSEKLDEAFLLEGLIWRFFETEGISTHSLSGHDKAAMRNKKLGFKLKSTTWAERLLKYSRDGKLDRSRLISASLLAMQNTERTADIHWFAKFHRSLEPSLEEVGNTRDLYEALINTGDAPKVKLGKEFIKVA